MHTSNEERIRKWNEFLKGIIEEKKSIEKELMSDELTRKVIEFAKSRGADLVSIISADRAAELAKEYVLWVPPHHYLEDAKAVIILALRNVDTVLMRPGILVSRQNIMMNILLNEISYWVGRYLQDLGYDAIPVYEIFSSEAASSAPITHHTEVQEETMIPIKVLAQEAGMGSIGISALLITPEYGPRVRLGAVITNAPLKSGRPLSENLCQAARRILGCNRCIEACEVHAIKPDGYVDFEACWMFNKVFKKRHGYSGCNTCQYVCPVGYYTNKLKEIPNLPKWLHKPRTNSKS